MRIKNQIINEWTIYKTYPDFSFVDNLEKMIESNQHNLKSGESLEIHQVLFVGEFKKNEKVYLVILNVVPEE
ncbi:hypothetical protein J27TS8_16160 [Robertmurraya siralis]|uniref:Uncharacterized protein n=1 Tax=Robertmurraya siralis TaxID=77777 RepID=A0A920BT48_9BACI|nr:hypothetical protein [Robertmurraya siralis]PAE21479.1 hypothetical protein CHH80_06130 [Bacillus sp. 7504-2]GIN61623.1 hypothetical protein J27TS8_16160 [Robertmurraya siralis]